MRRGVVRALFMKEFFDRHPQPRFDVLRTMHRELSAILGEHGTLFSRLDEVASPSRHAVAFGSAIVALKAQAKEDSHGPCSHRPRRQGIPKVVAAGAAVTALARPSPHEQRHRGTRVDGPGEAALRQRGAAGRQRVSVARARLRRRPRLPASVLPLSDVACPTTRTSPHLHRCAPVASANTCATASKPIRNRAIFEALRLPMLTEPCHRASAPCGVRRVL